MINIVIDGVDCTGKETQSKLLYEAFSKNNEAGVNLYSFPKYDSPTGQIIKSHLSGEERIDNKYVLANLFALDRYMELNRNPPKQLNVFDRYAQSNLIYLTLDIEDEDKLDAFISHLHRIEYLEFGIPYPDLVIFLSMPKQEVLRMISERGNKNGGDLDINERDIEFMGKVVDNGLRLANKLGWSIIDCWDEENSKMKTIEEIHDMIMRLEITRGGNDEI